MHHKRTCKGYPGMDFGWFLHFCWVQDRRYFILLTVGNVGNAIQVGYHGSSATQTLVCASTLSMKGGVVRKCAGKLGKPHHFWSIQNDVCFSVVFFGQEIVIQVSNNGKNMKKPWYIEGWRLVPYTFSETKSQMVPKDLNQNIGFQGLALIQGQIYNPVYVFLKGYPCIHQCQSNWLHWQFWDLQSQAEKLGFSWSLHVFFFSSLNLHQILIFTETFQSCELLVIQQRL